MSVLRLLPRLSLETRPGRSARMPDMVFDLQPAIDGIRSLRCDLEAYYWHRAADGSQDSQRFQISHWMRQLSDRSEALDGIVIRMGSWRLLLPDVSGAEARALQEAVTALEQWVDEDDPFDRALQVVTTALAAADCIGLRAAGGKSTRADSSYVAVRSREA
jgi:hypothetical protein